MGVKSLAPSHILTLMKQASIILLMVFCAVLQCFSRSIISGVVKNDEGAAVDFVSVIASPSNTPKTILSSALTDENGKFQMSVKSECDSLILKASSVEIAPTEIIVPNRTGNYEIIVENRAVELKEVVVKSKKRRHHKLQRRLFSLTDRPDDSRCLEENAGYYSVGCRTGILSRQTHQEFLHRRS